MKTNFALTLSYDGIGLLHRAFPGWNSVDEVSLDAADLAGALADLRARGEALDPSGLRSKLVIPNDQIKYLRFDAHGLEADEIADQARRNLDGATPYALDDLAYDWSISAGQVFVAAVARDTLAEAEAFATLHKFNPLCFVAMPEPRDFIGEPWFGQTQYADTILDEKGFIEQDTAAIRVIGSAAEAVVVAQSPDDTDEVTTSDLEPDDHEPDSAPAYAGDSLEFTSVASEHGEPEEAATAAEPEAPDTAPDLDEEDKEPQAEAEPEAEPETASSVAFASIRAVREPETTQTPRLFGATRDRDIVAATDDTPDDTETTDVAVDAQAAQPASVIDAVLPEDDSAPQPGDAIEFAATPVLEPRSEQSFQQPRRSGLSFFSRRRVTPEAHAVPQDAISRAPMRVSEPRVTQAQDESQRMTVFGAREAAKVGGKPRYLGVMLTAVLLVFLVGVAAWASMFMDDGSSRNSETETREDAVVASVPEVDSDAELLTDLAQPNLPEETGTATFQLAAVEQPLSIDDEALSDARPQPVPSELSEQAAKEKYAVTGIWQRAPIVPDAPVQLSIDDVYQASIDPKVEAQDAVALPALDSFAADSKPETPLPPAAPGTRFELDARGFVVATPEGALLPNGIRVFAGKPRLTPPNRPDTPKGFVENTTEPIANDPALERLAAFRPKARPGDLKEQTERSQLGGFTRDELADIRPKLRPQSAQERAEQAAAAETAALQRDLSESLDEAVDPRAGATAQAVVTSPKPLARPRNFDRTVKRAQRNTEQAQTQLAAVAVPRAQRVQPSAPTATTVARAATEKNAIKLRRMNLIGVYGSPADRRALVRLANGRYKKVKIGDRLDGGRVTAIGDSELRYNKSGRSVSLKLPRG